MLRLLVSIVAALALSATASARARAEIDVKLAANAATGPAAAESSAALLNRQPTPQSIARAESKLGEISPELMSEIGTGMARAREADLAGDQKACEEALAAVRRALGP